MKDWYIIAGIMIIFFLISSYLGKKLHAKTSLLISSVAFLVLMIVFTFNLIQHFSLPIMIAVCVYFIISLSGLILKYKNLQVNTSGRVPN